MAEVLRNWAGNITYGAARVHEPETQGEIQAIVRNAEKVRAVGSRHSFNAIAATDSDLVSMAGLDQLVRIDRDASTVTIEGGMRYAELCPLLHAEGYGLHNLASLPHISVIGACMTATHGSGEKNGNLATAVSAMRIVNCDGEAIALARGDEGFEGAVVSLGALGLVTEATLDLVPGFDMRQELFLDLPIEAVAQHFDALAGSGYSVSLFTDWQGDSVNQVWVKNRADAPRHRGDLFGARPAERAYHPIPTIDAADVTTQMGVSGPWFDRMPHFPTSVVPSAGGELQSEYFVARSDAVAAFGAIRAIQSIIAPHLLVSEVRMIAADDLWMSPCFKQDSVAFHFTWELDWPAVQQVLPRIEAALRPFRAKPHLGKLFTMTPQEVQAGYERLDDFRDLVRAHDPKGKFRNAFVEQYLFGI